MSDLSERIHQLSPKRLALVALELDEKLHELEQARREPIAIVGMACRFPGADSVEAFWRLLSDSVDAIREVTPDRWDIDALYDPNPDAPGRMSTRWAGLVDGWDQFDAQLFGISPREAQTMDPQQRVFLEVAWEALERAGQSTERLHRSSTGVFAGVCNSDYSSLLLQRDLPSIDAYFASGSAFSVLAGRLSYLLGLQGPAIAIDTACSSSLVAVHLACQSLRQQECRMAIAGGVNFITAPVVTVALSKAHMMAPDGRCKTFDASADGFVRGEGCGVMVLKRLSDAQADGDRILAVIRGSASNQDGRSSGLTAPNGPSQEAVIRAALSQAALEPADVDYVESHGTGTSLGDPIEVRALGAALGPGRAADRPLLIGSVKTNIGHLESAAGVAGLIKAVLALQHETIPPHLHFKTPNPHIAWETLPVKVTTATTPWRRSERRRVAGVSSFGFSGTNAHILVEEAPVVAKADNAHDRPLHVLTLSAKSAITLREHATRVAAWLRSTPQTWADACYTANTGRSHLTERLAVTAPTAELAAAALETFVADQPGPVTRGEAPAEAPEVAFLFTGQGAQYAGMGRRLYETQSVFRAALDRCDAALQGELSEPLLRVLFDTSIAPGRIDETAFTQPALFAIEYALAELWRSWGIRPSVVMGHSVGEITAACVAGVMSLEDALRLIAARGRLMQGLPAGGRMIALFTSVDRVNAAIAAHRHDVSIAAVNGPTNVVISGRGDVVESIRERLAAEGVQNQPLTVSHAFHSPLMAQIVEPFRRVAQTVTFSPPRIGYVSNLTGRLLAAGEVPDANYWCRHVMAPVLFGDSISNTIAAGYRVFVEVGPHPTLLGMARRVVDAKTGTWLPSLQKKGDDWAQMLASLGQLHVRGVPVDWRGVDSGYRRRLVSLPTYPFSRQRYWALDAPAAAKATSASRPAVNAGHPLLGHQLDAPIPIFEASFDPRTLPVLGEHRVGDTLVVPAPVYLESAAAAVSSTLGSGPLVVERLQIRQPLILTEGEARTVQIIVSGAAPHEASVQIFSASSDRGEGWTSHVSAQVRAASGDDIVDTRPSPAEIRLRCPDEIAGSTYYDRINAQGIHVGGDVRAIERIWRRDGEALAALVFPEAVTADTRFRLHPAILDAAMLVLGAAAPDDADTPSTTIPVLSGIDRIHLIAPAHGRLLSHVHVRETGARGSAVADLRLLREDGAPVAVLDGMRITRVEAAQLHGQRSASDELLYDVIWRAAGTVDVRCPPGDFLPSTSTLADALVPRSEELSAQYGLARYDKVLPQIERACAGYVAHAFSVLGVEFTPGERLDTTSLALRLRILPRHERLLARMLEMLAEEGVLTSAGRQWTVASTTASLDKDPDATCAKVGEADADFAGQARITSVCGRELASVLRGDVDPLHLLFPDGSFELTEHLYQHSPFAKASNTLVYELVGRIAGALPSGRTLRCLEIGAGTGGTSASVLPALPAARTDYCFTDLSKLFMTRAKQKFKQYPFVRYEILDIEREPVEQGFEAHSFDLIVASNVIHATADLRVTLSHVRRLLAPGGALLLLEGTERQRWVDLTFGLLEGWWKFTDLDRRPSHALLSQAQWKSALADFGFVDIDSVPRSQSPQALIVARTPMTAVGGTTPAEATRGWLLIRDHRGYAEAFATRLKKVGASVEVVSAQNPERESVRAAIARMNGGLEIVNFASLDLSDAGTDAPAQAATRVLTDTARLVADVADSGRTSSTRLWLVTRGAQSPDGNTTGLQPLQATMWGFGRVIALEHPEHWGGVIDLDPEDNPGDSAATLIAAIVSSDAEDQIALRAGARYVPRIVRATASDGARVTFRDDASYLVTGGTGGIAVSLVRWMAERGAKHLVLMSRHGLPARSTWDGLPAEHATRRLADVIRELEAQGTGVEVVACDVTNEQAVSRLIATFGADRPPLRGIMHAAAAIAGCEIRQLDEEAIASMLAPKVDGTRVLDRLTRGLALEHFVLFSSTTALWGVAGLAHYAAANEYLDQVALERAAAGLPALSVNWGTWEDMRLASEEDRRTFVRSGLNPMPSASALERLERLMGQQAHRKIVAAVDWSVLKPVYEAKRVRPMLADVTSLVHKAKADGGSRGGADTSRGVVSWLRDAPGAEQRDRVIAYLREQVAAVLGLPEPHAIRIDEGLFDLGMDSLMSVELKNRLETGLEQPLPSTLTFNYPNVGALAEYVISDVLLDTAMKPEPLSAKTVAPAPADLDDLSEDELADLLASRLGKR